MERKTYSIEFKRACVEKVFNRGLKSLNQVAQECNVPIYALYKWPKELANLKDMPIKNTCPQDRSGLEKLNMLCEFSLLEEEKKGEFIRSQGLHFEHLKQWRMQAEEALNNVYTKINKKSVQTQNDQREIKALKKELERKEKALAEAAALLVLKKKVQSIWETSE